MSNDLQCEPCCRLVVDSGLLEDLENQFNIVIIITTTIVGMNLESSQRWIIAQFENRRSERRNDERLTIFSASHVAAPYFSK